MSSDKKEPILDHDYDGIKELDNSLPRWWLGTFYITIVFSVIYYAVYEWGNGKTIDKEFEEDVALVEAKQAGTEKKIFPDAAKLADAEKQTNIRAVAAPIFQSKCSSCHGDKGQGIIGPNLTDSYWIHGDGTSAAISKTIYEGVLDKGMPAWQAMLKEEEIYALSAFIKTLKGSNPANAKAPQGQLIK